ncbi:helix-turn-helix transcriptional regulator [Saccharothrix luteola]|uniref:helix-turn-helix transcriptional regulator n=1 Tax=Saccharothrix luteola TaxID=2893018 RepID=UPI001E356AD2|nr:LuxR family transcriptional regulator [Saccharothrix luteola]MCC8246216.1 AAA family ATPase [Saccharothrix luteola]
MRHAGRDLVGREPEVAVAAGVLDRARTGAACLVVSGEAGIGKTALWEHVLRDAERRGYAVLSCRPAQPEARLSYGALIDLVERVDDELIARLPGPRRSALDVALLRRDAEDGPGDPRAVHVAVLDIVRAMAATAPVVLAVDDAQWLDEPTAAVLEYVVRRLADEHVAVVVSVRADDVPLGLAGRADLAHLRLSGLSVGALHRLLRSHLGTPLPRPTLVRLRQASGGNPFYALEIARALPDPGGVGAFGLPLPTTRAVEDLLADRLAVLPDHSRDALLCAAALSHPTVDLVRRASDDPGRAEDALVDAEDRGVIEIVSGAIRFTHPLLSSTLFSAVSGTRRRRVHRRLAQVVDDPETRALHLALSTDGPDPEVARALSEAARGASARNAPTAAARLWELAGAHATDPHHRAVSLTSAVVCRYRSGDASGARRLLEAFDVEDVPPGPERAALLVDLAYVVFFEEGPVRATAMTDEALAQIGDDPVLRARAYLRRSLFCQDDTRLRWRNTEQAREAIAGHEDGVPADLVACILVSSAYYRLLAGGGLVTDDIARAAALVPPTDQTREARTARSTLRVLAKYLDPVQGRALIEAAHRDEVAREDEAVAVHELVHLAELDVWLGDWARAGQRAAEAVEAAEQSGQRPWFAYALYTRALVDAHRGRWEQAHEAATRGLEVAAELGDPWVSVHQRAVLGFVELSRHEPGAARGHLTAAVALCAEVGMADFPISTLYGDLVEAVVELGEPVEATRLLAELEERRERAPRPWITVVTARSRALVRMAWGDPEGAEEALATAAEALDRLPMPFERARTDLVRGRVLRRRRLKLAAREAFLAARRAFDGLGAPSWVEEVDAELARLGLRRGDEHELTATELRIARLVAAGMSNREVAGAAYVTEKTVEAHLTRIYRKTGVRTRRELARLDFLRAR